MNDYHTAWQMRLELIKAYITQEITLAELAQSAELSPLQCIRLVKRYLESGPAGLLSRRQGKPGNHQLKADIKAQAAAHPLTRPEYESVSNLVNTEHGIQISKKTVLKIIIA
ncbi:TPA: helix-turn-helix domain containing protein [Escherichia coli]|nr:helix-turn-helix domain containing protein [Escherichia coli]ELO1963737.1 helix-turn-helix domain containing protein [Escherichia coli]ELO3082644.1 helix-turn-helix domain containing protein [Escherichia coli]ELO3213436.1 helix-turn-helix domain containing protein [Escherichia coli]ELO4358636.1 helix-turn-helix domain containing protein [Escherichia coli]